MVPRKFDEVKALYSPQMTDVFKGGLIYEFTEEPNNYGLVRVLPDGNVQLLSDFHLARNQFSSIPDMSQFFDTSYELESLPKCEESYQNLFTTKTLPPCAAPDLIHKGVKVQQGSYVELTEEDLRSPYKVFDVDGTLVYLALPHVEVTQPSFMRSKTVSGTYTPFLEIEPYGMSDSEGDTDYDLESESGWGGTEYDTEDRKVSEGEVLDSEPEKISLIKWTTKKVHKAWNSFKKKVASALACSDPEN